MSLGNAELRSERVRSPGGLLLDDPEASHAYAWLFKHEPATVAEYVGAVEVNERQARLAVNRLLAHRLLTETDDGYAVDPLHEVVEGVHVTPGVAAVLAVQLENHAVRKLVRRHGTFPLAEAAACWPLVSEGRMRSREVGDVLGIGEHDGVTATNALRAVEDHLAVDPHLAEIPRPEPASARSPGRRS